MGIDPGRQINERFGGVRKHLPRRGQIAAMRERFQDGVVGGAPM